MAGSRPLNLLPPPSWLVRLASWHEAAVSPLEKQTIQRAPLELAIGQSAPLAGLSPSSCYCQAYESRVSEPRRSGNKNGNHYREDRCCSRGRYLPDIRSAPFLKPRQNQYVGMATHQRWLKMTSDSGGYVGPWWLGTIRSPSPAEIG